MATNYSSPQYTLYLHKGLPALYLGAPADLFDTRRLVSGGQRSFSGCRQCVLFAGGLFLVAGGFFLVASRGVLVADGLFLVVGSVFCLPEVFFWLPAVFFWLPAGCFLLPTGCCPVLSAQTQPPEHKIVVFVLGKR